MADQIQQTKQVNSDGTASVQTTEVVDNRNDTIDNASVAARILWFITAVIAIILAFRFILILTGANSANGFANFVYAVSHPFAAPFFGLFSYQQVYGVAKFEASTLVAIAVYTLIGYGLTKLVTIRRTHQA